MSTMHQRETLACYRARNARVVPSHSLQSSGAVASATAADSVIDDVNVVAWVAWLYRATRPRGCWHRAAARSPFHSITGVGLLCSSTSAM